MNDFVAFLIPRGIAVPFVVAMVALFVWGVGRTAFRLRAFQRTLDGAAKRYGGGDRSHLKFDPLTYLKMEVDEEHLFESVEIIPGMLVSIGILGTFVGLGIAIGQSEHVLGSAGGDPARTAAALTSLMATLSSKFTASAYGIALSMLFGRMVVLPLSQAIEHRLEIAARGLAAKFHPVDEMAEQLVRGVGDHLATTMTALVDRIERSSAERDKRLGEQLASGFTVLRDAHTQAVATFVERKAHEDTVAREQEERTASLIRDCIEGIARVGTAVEAQAALVTRSLSEGFSSMTAAEQAGFDGLTRSIDRMSGASAQIAEAGQRLTGLAKEITSALDQVGASIQAHLNEGAEASRAALTAQGEVLAKSMESLSRQVQDAITDLKHASTQQSTELNEALQQFQDSQQQANEAQRLHLEGMREGQRTAADQQTQHLKETLGTLGTEVQGATKQLAIAGEKQANGFTVALSALNGALKTNLDTMAEQQRLSAQSQLGQLNTALQLLSDQIQEAIGALTSAALKQVQSGQEMSKALGTGMSAMNAAVAQMEHELKENLTESNRIQEASRMVQIGLKGVNDNLTDKIGKFNDTMSKLADVQQKLAGVTERQTPLRPPSPANAPTPTGRAAPPRVPPTEREPF